MNKLGVAKKIGWGALGYIGILVGLILILAFLASSDGGDSVSNTSEFSAYSSNDNSNTVSSGELIPSHAPVLGPQDAKITIVEFSDFECPFCQAAFPTIRQLLNKYPNDIRLVYRHFPLRTIHPEAREFAHASMCANEQDLFWPFHDRLFTQQGEITSESLLKTAREVGLNPNSFLACQSSGNWYDEIDQDIADAVALGGRGTPTWVINGELVQGLLPLEVWEQIVQELLSA